MNTLTQLHRAAANAMWPILQTRKWRDHTRKRAISPTGNPRSHTSNTSTIPGPTPTIELLEQAPYQRALATSDETHLTLGIAIELTYADHCLALARIPHAAAADYEDALDGSTRVPFLWHRRDGYTRNPELPRGAATALRALAAAATITVLTPEQDAAIIAARREGDPISLNAVLAAMQRAGLDNTGISRV